MAWYGWDKPKREDWREQMDLEDREEQVLLGVQALREERDALTGEIAELRAGWELLEEERDQARLRVIHLEDTMAGVTQRIEDFIALDMPVEVAAKTLLGALDRALGFERYVEECPAVHDIFRAMRAVRDAMDARGARDRVSWFRKVLRDENYHPEEQECPRAKPTDPEASTPSSR